MSPDAFVPFVLVIIIGIMALFAGTGGDGDA